MSAFFFAPVPFAFGVNLGLCFSAPLTPIAIKKLATRSEGIAPTESQYSALFLFVGNTAFSGIIIYDYYLDNQTTTTFVTNVLFMITKLGDVYTTIRTDKNIFYSAYLKGKVQFNDVDPDKLKEICMTDFQNIDLDDNDVIENKDDAIVENSV